MCGSQHAIAARRRRAVEAISVAPLASRAHYFRRYAAVCLLRRKARGNVRVRDGGRRGQGGRGRQTQAYAERYDIPPGRFIAFRWKTPRAGPSAKALQWAIAAACGGTYGTAVLALASP